LSRQVHKGKIRIHFKQEFLLLGNVVRAVLVFDPTFDFNFLCMPLRRNIFNYGLLTMA